MNNAMQKVTDALEAHGSLRSGAEWTCPAHKDRTPSLSITENETGVLVHCFAGCETEAIVSTLGLTMSDLFDQSFPRNGVGPPIRTQRIVNYDYRCEQNQILFRVVRNDSSDGGKVFRQQAPDGVGGWKTRQGAMDGVRRVLFHLPEVLAAPAESPVFIVEGEKDVLSVAALGLVATTNPGGAEKWKHCEEKGEDRFSEPFRNRDVLILPDNDKTGRSHSIDVATRLSGIAATIRIVELPDLPIKGDVSDWISSGGTAEQLMSLVTHAAPWVSRAQETTDGATAAFNLTDVGNSKRLVQLHGRDLRYCHLWKKWLVWDDHRWITDGTGEVERRAKETIRQLYTEAAAENDDTRRRELARWAKKSEDVARIRAMIALAQSETGIPVGPDNLDSDPWLFTVLNGTLDLRTGELLPHNRNDLTTRLVPIEYHPHAEAPRWESFLDEVMASDEALAAFLRRAVGYSLTGLTTEHCLFFLHGLGRNGKSVFLKALLALSGAYGMSTPTETLMVKRTGGIPNDLARLKGARVVTTVEVDEGKKLAEALVKEMTGGDKISARFMRAEWFDFFPEFKIWMAANHKPVIRGTDTAIWSRIRLIPFKVSFEGREDRDLTRQLEIEAEGILAWAVRGCLEWQREGLCSPEKVLEATKDYRTEMDTIGEFVEDRCTSRPGGQATAGALYAVYKLWCKENEESPVSNRSFGSRLKERGLDNGKNHLGKRCWLGISLIETASLL